MIDTQLGTLEVPIKSGSRSHRRTREMILTIKGRFDLAAAQRTAAVARLRAEKARVTIDLRRAPIDDVALAVLVREMAGRPVMILGLTRHHERLLRYLEGAVETDRGAEDG